MPNSHFDLYEATGIRFTTGDEQSIVATTTKDLEILGSIPVFTQVRFVEATAEDTLETVEAKCSTVAESLDVENGIVANVTFPEGAARVFVCYRFPESTLYRRLEETEGNWSVLSSFFTVKSLSEVNPSFLVAGVETTMTFSGVGLENTSVALAKEDCSSVPESAFTPIVSGVATLTPAADARGELLVCMQFPNEPVYALQTVAIASVDPQTITNIINVPHRITISGQYVAKGDRVGVMVDGVCDLSQGGVLDDNLSLLLKLSLLGRWTLCYKFAGYRSAIPVDITVNVVMETLEFYPAFVVSGASNELRVLIPAFNEEDTVTLEGVTGVSRVEEGVKIVSFSTMEFTEATATVVYKHAYAGTIERSLPVYTVSLSKEGAYFGLDEMVTVSGVGSEFINAIGFATGGVHSGGRAVQRGGERDAGERGCEELGLPRVCVVHDGAGSDLRVVGDVQGGWRGQLQSACVDCGSAAADDDPSQRCGAGDGVGRGSVFFGQSDADDGQLLGCAVHDASGGVRGRGC